MRPDPRSQSHGNLETVSYREASVEGLGSGVSIQQEIPQSRYNSIWMILELSTASHGDKRGLRLEAGGTAEALSIGLGVYSSIFNIGGTIKGNPKP